MSAFERVPGNAINTPTENRKRDEREKAKIASILAGYGDDCMRCGGRTRHSGEHRLGGCQFTCEKCGTTYTP